MSEIRVVPARLGSIGTTPLLVVSVDTIRSPALRIWFEYIPQEDDLIFLRKCK